MGDHGLPARHDGSEDGRADAAEIFSHSRRRPDSASADVGAREALDARVPVEEGATKRRGYVGRPEEGLRELGVHFADGDCGGEGATDVFVVPVRERQDQRTLVRHRRRLDEKAVRVQEGLASDLSARASESARAEARQRDACAARSGEGCGIPSASKLHHLVFDARDLVHSRHRSKRDRLSVGRAAGSLRWGPAPLLAQ